jgi:hypothetical protein
VHYVRKQVWCIIIYEFTLQSTRDGLLKISLSSGCDGSLILLRCGKSFMIRKTRSLTRAFGSWYISINLVQVD